jgi:hypothetical protein
VQIRKWLAQASNETLKRIISGLIAILALVVWLVARDAPADCTYNCNTDVSANRR